ncbi:hypothetical protein HFP89_06335 [Wenzhouxiangella sp. XN79A]|uniref:expansin EXLX1 family cellulose-binding protein n=1 Tax=Wenzhouxiangella sp. XN79A TaxID=2724193 RepID=UPI00144AA9A5|nr:expansin EXLX1 family cellulose-binding protein [Wenzhouxiangella sp. XN79A]NKI34780.1 hypothetical protein [Wenzhouxiangella sp. XN79A]
MVLSPLAGAGTSCPAPFNDSGSATFYDATGGFNACTLDIGNGLVAAINDAQWDGSARCGECLRVTGPEGTVLVRVTDRCVGCAEGDLDLSEPAFDAIADPVQGIVPISWERVECPVSGPVAYRFQGSNSFFYKIQVRDHRYGVASMAYRSGGSFVPMNRVSDNHFQASGVPNLSVAVVRITATTGESLIDTLGDPSQTGVIAGAAQFAPCDGVFVDGFESS